MVEQMQPIVPDGPDRYFIVLGGHAGFIKFASLGLGVLA